MNLIDCKKFSDHAKTDGVVTRRGLLQWGMAVSVGAVLPACGGDAGNANQESLPQPQVLRSSGGVLELHLNVQYADLSMAVPDDAALMDQWASYPVSAKPRALALRTFNGQYMAPTLMLKPGDTLRVWVHNRLPASPQSSSWQGLNHQNSTNLHFHGLHVDPKEIRPGVFGDYVVDKATAGIKPGDTRYHEIKIPLDHSSGIYWYHPHLHGSTNAQVSSGMFGAILIRKENEAFWKASAVDEQVLFAHKLTLTEQGRTDTLEESFARPASAFLINGVHQPTIVLRPGEVRHWHIVNPTSFYPLYPVLDGHDLHVYARDGNNFNKRFRLLNRETVKAGLAMKDWPGSYIYPGGRLSMVFKASLVPGEYFLRAAACPSWHRPTGSSNYEEVIARVIVQGEAVNDDIPDPTLLRSTDEYLPITDEELAAKGGMQRSMRLAILSPGDLKLAPMPSDESWVLGTDGVTSVFAVGSDAMQSGMAPYHSALTPTQLVPFNGVEEWTVWNFNAYPHPFHIHVNDCYVTKVNGESVDPFWADTLPVPPVSDSKPGSITFRMRFLDFDGSFVWHCHALDHEDLGMMQAVEIKV